MSCFLCGLAGEDSDDPEVLAQLDELMAQTRRNRAAATDTAARRRALSRWRQWAGDQASDAGRRRHADQLRALLDVVALRHGLDRWAGETAARRAAKRATGAARRHCLVEQLGPVVNTAMLRRSLGRWCEWHADAPERFVRVARDGST